MSRHNVFNEMADKSASLPSSGTAVDVSNMNITAKNVTVTGTMTAAVISNTGGQITTSVNSTGAITSSSPTAGIGYSASAGGAYTQASNKGTAVPITTLCGTITMNNAALLGATAINFAVTATSLFAATDCFVAHIRGGSTAGTYSLFVNAISATSVTLTLTNLTGGSLSEAVVINYVIIKSVST